MTPFDNVFAAVTPSIRPSGAEFVTLDGRVNCEAFRFETGICGKGGEKVRSAPTTALKQTHRGKRLEMPERGNSVSKRCESVVDTVAVLLLDSVCFVFTTNIVSLQGSKVRARAFRKGSCSL
jgi:hypothetical protein